ncbi:MAG: FAD-dependent oxidoreductase [Acidobacteria bacterium]|nr:FAD-dependent oxidoreductase [Acidobacteriota bacterium]MBI3657606.1 FAD-dependent oxidoreductase [Acidobacteriota bacterium]
MPPKRVIILGAGPGGLAAAANLAKNKIPVTVFEKRSFIGGLCHTVVKDGFRFDLGGHRWFTKNNEVDRFVSKLMGDEFIDVDRVSRIFFDDKFFDYPIKIKNVLKNAGLIYSLRAMLGYARAQIAELINPTDDGLSMEDAYTKQFGWVLYETFFKRYSEKVWGRDCRELSADWVAQRTKGLSVFVALRQALFKSRQSVESLIEHFKYPKLGYIRISERLRDVLLENGGELQLDQTVTTVVHEEKAIRHIVVKRSDGADQPVAADQFISTIPLNVLVRIMRPAAPRAVLDAADKLQFRALITVNLMLNREQVTQDNWLYIHDPQIKFARMHEPKNWSPSMAPPGKTSLVAEYFCTPGDEIWQSSDEALCRQTVDDLVDRLHFIKREEVIGAFALREKAAYPVYTLGYEKPLNILKSYVKEFSNLKIIGRGGTFRYNNSDHSIEAGILVAKNLLGFSYDLDQVNASPEYLEEKRGPVKKLPVKIESFVDMAD